MKNSGEYQEKIRALVVGEYVGGGTSYRRLAVKYGVARTTICRWVESESGRGKAAVARSELAETEETAEVRRLRGELEKSRLENKLLKAMIEIAEEQLGVDIRKKRGARR